MRITTKSTREVEEVTILCDLCGKSAHMPRYACNRICNRCGREVCAECQGPYHDDFAGDEIICVICKSMEPEYLPEINDLWKQVGDLKLQWKENSLARKAAPSGKKEGQ